MGFEQQLTGRLANNDGDIMIYNCKMMEIPSPQKRRFDPENSPFLLESSLIKTLTDGSVYANLW